MKNLMYDLLIFFAGFITSTLMFVLFCKPSGYPNTDDLE